MLRALHPHGAEVNNNCLSPRLELHTGGFAHTGRRGGNVAQVRVGETVDALNCPVTPSQGVAVLGTAPYPGLSQ